MGDMNELAWVTQSQVPSLGLIKSATVTLTDAQIKGLPTTPVIIVPAVGHGKIVIVVGSTAKLDNTAGVYSNVDATAKFFIGGTSSGAQSSILDISWGLTDGSNPVIAISPSFVQVNDSVYGTTGYGSSDYLTSFDNSGLYASCVNGAAGNFTEGNAANTLKITVYYIVVDV